MTPGIDRGPDDAAESGVSPGRAAAAPIENTLELVRRASTGFCWLGESQVYAALTIKRELPGFTGRWSDVCILGSNDAGKSWYEVSLRLLPGCRLWPGPFADWPPETLESLTSEQGRLCLRFKDGPGDYGKGILPFRVSTGSFWQAEYVPSRRRWSLRRIRRLIHKEDPAPCNFETEISKSEARDLAQKLGLDLGL